MRHGLAVQSTSPGGSHMVADNQASMVHLVVPLARRNCTLGEVSAKIASGCLGFSCSHGLQFRRERVSSMPVSGLRGGATALALLSLVLALGACRQNRATGQWVNLATDPVGAACEVQTSAGSAKLDNAPGYVLVPVSFSDMTVTCRKEGYEPTVLTVPNLARKGATPVVPERSLGQPNVAQTSPVVGFPSYIPIRLELLPPPPLPSRSGPGGIEVFGGGAPYTPPPGASAPILETPSSSPIQSPPPAASVVRSPAAASPPVRGQTTAPRPASPPRSTALPSRTPAVPATPPPSAATPPPPASSAPTPLGAAPAAGG